MVGAGVWGASTALAFQKKGYDTMLCDMYGPGNIWSGSGGLSRIIRLGYGSDSVYVDLTARSFQLWDQLFVKTGQKHYRETGLLWLFKGYDASYAENSVEPIRRHGYKIEELNVAEVANDFPVFDFQDIDRVFLEEKAGILYASKCCEDLVHHFVTRGGQYIRGQASISDMKSSNAVIRIDGEVVKADFSVWACGPWNRKIFPDVLGKVSYISKQDVYYFAVPARQTGLFSPPRMPVWFEYDLDSPFYYGMPYHLNQGVKLAYDDRSEEFDPDHDDRLPSAQHMENARSYLTRRFPSLSNTPVLNVRVCQYENSLDGHFIIDRHPLNDKVIIMGGSSGHGFKMGPALGEMVVDCLDSEKVFPAPFSLDRFEEGSSIRSQFSA